MGGKMTESTRLALRLSHRLLACVVFTKSAPCESARCDWSNADLHQPITEMGPFWDGIGEQSYYQVFYLSRCQIIWYCSLEYLYIR